MTNLSWQTVFFRFDFSIQFLDAINSFHVTGIGTGTANDSNITSAFLESTGHHSSGGVIEH